jgi:hypothetical protein
MQNAPNQRNRRKFTDSLRFGSVVADTPFVVPYSGSLRIIYPEAYKRDMNPPNPPPPLPSGSHLAVQFANTTHEYPIVSYFGEGVGGTSAWHVCGPLMEGIPDWYYAGNPGFAVRSVHAGDTVRFVVNGEFTNPTEQIYGPSGDSTYLVILDTPTPPGCAEPHEGPEWSQFYMKIYPITVQIFPPVPAPEIDGARDLPFALLLLPPGVVATTFSWIGEPKNTPAGNSPSVRFSPDSVQQYVTIDTAKWYAFPDDTCKCKDKSTYLIRAQAVINSVVYSDTTDLTVVIPDPIGQTWPPDILDNIEYVPVVANGDTNKWVIGSNSTLERFVSPPFIFVGNASQFYDKTVAHEYVHFGQHTLGASSHLFSPDALWKIIRIEERATRAELVGVVDSLKESYKKRETERLLEILCDLEDAAYAVSDPIPPRYYFQRKCSQCKDSEEDPVLNGTSSVQSGDPNPAHKGNPTIRR